LPDRAPHERRRAGRRTGRHRHAAVVRHPGDHTVADPNTRPALGAAAGGEPTLRSRSRSRVITGISRVLTCRSYALKNGIALVWILRSRTRSAPVLTFARAVKRSPSASTVTTGCAVRFRYQSGCVGAPPFEAMTMKRSPS